MSTKVGGRVTPKELHRPQVVTGTTWGPRRWAFTCGNCFRDVVQWAFFGKPKCPFCGTRNVPDFGGWL